LKPEEELENNGRRRDSAHDHARPEASRPHHHRRKTFISALFSSTYPFILRPTNNSTYNVEPGKGSPNMSPQQLAANQSNAQFSTGPVTVAGKERVKYNSLKHGCYSSVVVLPHEDASDFAALGEYLRDRFHPATPEHEEIVQKMQDARWRMARVVAIESNLHTVSIHQHLSAIDEQFGPDIDAEARYALAQAVGYQANARTFEQLSKQEARLQRTLTALEKQLTSGPVLLPTPPRIRAVAPPAPVPQPENGFVPNKYLPDYPADMPVFTGTGQRRKRQQWLRQNGYKNLN
jgi:hypothetical protein